MRTRSASSLPRSSRFAASRTTPSSAEPSSWPPPAPAASQAGALSADELHGIAAELGADVPYFLTAGPQLGEGDGTELTPLDLPQEYWVVLVVPSSERKHSTAAVYEAFDARDGAEGFEQRRAELARTLVLGDLAALPPNDLARSPLAGELSDQGAFRADVTGAGPAVYGLFAEESQAVAASAALAVRGETWVTTSGW